MASRKVTKLSGLFCTQICPTGCVIAEGTVMISRIGLVGLASLFGTVVRRMGASSGAPAASRKKIWMGFCAPTPWLESVPISNDVGIALSMPSSSA